MDTTNDRAVNRVLRKLSAMRATFNEQEQEILDALILRDDSEVSAHMRHPGAGAERNAPTPDEVNAHMRHPGAGAERNAPAPDEVNAHMRHPGAGAERNAPAPDEVNAHAASADRRHPVKMPRQVVSFDPESGEYRMVPRG